ncbi:MAG TPA: mannose-1-phosphate guanylyltransferase, partial [Flavobacteriaceae bacterium]|nr:mannose-1-phosphate guanylyltransferase [Flavobacteriaceae bacterium]
MQNKNYYAILMAGGVGSRFWPVSTESFPKQFHDMLGTGDTLLQKTFQRLNKLIPTENIFILTNEKYNDLVLQQLPQVKQRQVVLEPAMRNTAPCILYASLKIQKENPDAVMIVAPSDHWIEDEDAFSQNVQQA